MLEVLAVWREIEWFNKGSGRDFESLLTLTGAVFSISIRPFFLFIFVLTLLFRFGWVVINCGAFQFWLLLILLGRSPRRRFFLVIMIIAIVRGAVSGDIIMIRIRVFGRGRITI